MAPTPSTSTVSSPNSTPTATDRCSCDVERLEYRPAVLRPADWAAEHADGDVPAVDVPQAPLPAGVRVAVCGGGRLHLVASVLPHRHRRPVAAPHNPDEDHNPVR